MKVSRTFFRSKVAARIFFTFIVCALLPIVALAVLSITHVTRQLDKDARARLRQGAQSMGASIAEHLALLEGELGMIASNVVPHQRNLTRQAGLDRRFLGIKLVPAAGEHVDLFGHITRIPDPTPEELRHLSDGRTLITLDGREDEPARIFMTVPLDPADTSRGTLVAELETGHLFGFDGERPLPPRTELCVLGPSSRVLMTSHTVVPSLVDSVNAGAARGHAGFVEWTDEETEAEYLASFWSVFNKGAYHLPQFVVVLSESKKNMLVSVANFKRTFALIALLTIWVVLLLIVAQIRRSLIPLEQLRSATGRIARREFDARVHIRSGDEFEELGKQFNSMAVRLGRQYTSLLTIAEIDRAILSSLDTETIVRTMLLRMPDVMPCDAISITLVDTRAGASMRTYVHAHGADNVEPTKDIGFTQEQVQRFRDRPKTFIIDSKEEVPHYLRPLTVHGMKSFLVLPVFLHEELRGLVGLGYVADRPPQHEREDLVRIRQLADQVAVTLSNANLLEEMDRQMWGALTALARAIDAISPWTGGHSERVAKLAVKIGRVLMLPQSQLDTLLRGGLVHDIGKIGVPQHILNKKGKLTEEETRQMRAHVEVGVRIIDPISAYVDVIPIIREHHEWWDGSGYPREIEGEEINLLARIMAVADCFDSLNSERPYRGSLGRARTINFIQAGAETQFDPIVVEAFMRVMEEQKQSIMQAARIPT
jgi:putative nucleotidyltransferase with HDIG domain